MARKLKRGELPQLMREVKQVVLRPDGMVIWLIDGRAVECAPNLVGKFEARLFDVDEASQELNAED